MCYTVRVNGKGQFYRAWRICFLHFLLFSIKVLSGVKKLKEYYCRQLAAKVTVWLLVYAILFSVTSLTAGVFLQLTKRQHFIAVARVQQQNDDLLAQATATATREMSWQNYLDRMNEQQKADSASEECFPSDSQTQAKVTCAPDVNTFEFGPDGSWISLLDVAKSKSTTIHITNFPTAYTAYGVIQDSFDSRLSLTGQQLPDGVHYLWQMFLDGKKIFQAVNLNLHPRYVFYSDDCFEITWAYTYDIYKDFYTTFDSSGKIISQCGDNKNGYAYK